MRKGVTLKQSRKEVLDDIINYCDSNSIELLGKFDKISEKYNWLCLKHNLTFKSKFSDIKRDNSSCKECQSEKLKNTFIKTGKTRSYQDTIALIKKTHQFSACLSPESEYINGKSYFKMKCEKDHIFTMNCRSLIRGRWCPICIKGQTEQKVRSIFESIFNKQFPTVRPEFLKNPKTNRNLELDGYCEELKLAFEYDGRFHYEDRDTKSLTEKQINRHGSLELTKEKDLLKDKLCKKEGITLIRIPYWENKNLLNFIKLELEKTYVTLRTF